jgi:hypothetical protein
MAQIQKGTTYTTGDQVTAANLNNLADAAILLAGAITDQTAKTVPLAADTILLHSAADTALRKSTLTQVFANATGIPISTGISGLGTGIATFLATPSSANLASALTDETGSGANVFATSPTLVTPNLGTPSAVVLTNASGTASININGTVGATTPSTGSFTTLNTSGTIVSKISSGVLTYKDSVSASVGLAEFYRINNGSTLSGLIGTRDQVFGGTINDFAIDGRAGNLVLGCGGSIVATFTSTGLNSTAIGATTPSTGAFTTVAASTSASFSGAGLPYAANSLMLRNNGTGDSQLWALGPNTSTNGTMTFVVADSDGSATNTFAVGSNTGLAVTGALGATGNVYSGNNGFSIGTGTTDGFYVTPLGTMLQSFNAAVADGQYVRRRGSDGVITYYYRDNTNVGSISVTTTATAYNTSSDYRLKDIIGPLVASGAFIDALKPKVGTWKADGSKFVGFLAHEFAEVSPSSVQGEKDAVDAEGNPKYQGMQASSAEVIANLVAELQSVRARLAVLESK